MYRFSRGLTSSSGFRVLRARRQPDHRRGQAWGGSMCPSTSQVCRSCRVQSSSTKRRARQSSGTLNCEFLIHVSRKLNCFCFADELEFGPCRDVLSARRPSRAQMELYEAVVQEETSSDVRRPPQNLFSSPCRFCGCRPGGPSRSKLVCLSRLTVMHSSLTS